MACANPACQMNRKAHPTEVCKSYITPSTENIVVSCFWAGCMEDIKRKDIAKHFSEAHGVKQLAKE